MTPQSRIALVTGSAGFIGFHMAKRLLKDGWTVVGLDALTDYYDVTLKEKRHEILGEFDAFTPVIDRLEEPGLLMSLFKEHKPQVVLHFAAQAGVRYSIDAPRSYVESNLVGTFELLEAARAFPPEHMLLASTSSIYGASEDMPFAETHKADAQMSFYAATKKANEAMAHSYAHLYDLPITMFRFFTVYGPWGRPDMALFKFTKAILNNEPIDIYNYGKMQRDFTYIDDLIAGIKALIGTIPAADGQKTCEADSLSAVAPWRVVNIGNGQPVQLMDYVEAIEEAIGIKSQKNFLPMQAGDVPATWAAAELLQNLTGARPQTDVRDGVREFVSWYRAYNGN